MYIVRFYTIQVVVFSGFFHNSYTMVDRSEKHPQQQYRQDRQLRPVLNSIIFLIAANLVAKGALGLGAYQAPLPANIQGSLFLTLNSPQAAGTPQGAAPQYVPVLYPVGQVGPAGPAGPAGSSTIRPIAQTQVIHIGEPFEEVDGFTKNDPYTQKLYINRYNSIEDPLDTSSSEEITIKTKPEDTTETNTELTTQLDTELLPQNTSNKDEEPTELARQNQRPPTTTAATTPTPEPSTTMAAATANPSTAPGPVYGPPGYPVPSTGYGLPNFGYIRPSYGPPNVVVNVMNMTEMNSTNNGTGYYYLPTGQYGPYTGRDNVSIAYGAPQNTNSGYAQRPFYPKPFFSSPSDPYLNNYDMYYNNFYNSPSYYNDMYKYSDFFKNFYNKFDYNNYPAYSNNYLGKWN